MESQQMCPLLSKTALNYCLQDNCAWWQVDRCGVLQKQSTPLVIQFDGKVGVDGEIDTDAIEKFCERLRTATAIL